MWHRFNVIKAGLAPAGKNPPGQRTVVLPY